MNASARPLAVSRRGFLKTSAALSVLGSGRAWAANAAASSAAKRASGEELRAILEAPVLRLEAVTSPVKVASLELLRNGRNYLVRARTTDGLEVVTVPNPAIMAKAAPVFLGWVAPVFKGKGRADDRGAARGGLPAREQLQDAGPALLGGGDGGGAGDAGVAGTGGEAAGGGFLRRGEAA